MLAESNALLKMQFADLEQQRETATFGMWVFLVTELLLFGALFTMYAVYRLGSPAGFADASQHLEMKLGAINTGLLIGSSLMMATAVHGAQTGGRRRLIGGLLMTILSGTLFLAIKGVEYYHHYQDRKVPGLSFVYPGQYAGPAKIFFSLYFGMTGLHALHMMIGLGVVTFILLQSWRGRFSAEYHTPVELTGLYWHFVDIVWIFLFPLFYLIVRH